MCFYIELFFPRVILTVEYTKAISFTMLLQSWFKKRRAQYRKYQQSQILQCASADGQDSFSKTFVGVLKHHPVQAPDEDRIFRCHWHFLMAVTPYPFSNKELCIQNISCPFWGSVRCGCPSLRKYLIEDKRKGSNPESSLLLHKSQTHGNPHSDLYSSLLSHCTMLTLTRPCGNKHIRTGTGQVPSEKTFHDKSRVSPKSTSSPLYYNKYKKTTFWAFIRGECDQWPRLPPGLFPVPPFNGTVMLLGVLLTQVLLFLRKHKSPSHAH